MFGTVSMGDPVAFLIREWLAYSLIIMMLKLDEKYNF